MDTSDSKPISQIILTPFKEAIGIVYEVNETKDEVQLVLTSCNRVSICIPRRLIEEGSIIPEADEFVSILRTDTGYNILALPHDPDSKRRDRSSHLDSERGDT